MKLRYLDLQKIIKKIDDTVDWDIIMQLEEVYELWTWHPGMG
tara:strand:+ start:526 stop:651 length:126 start_codon:yes stop_codon:yes gene_type:complete